MKLPGLLLLAALSPLIAMGCARKNLTTPELYETYCARCHGAGGEGDRRSLKLYPHLDLLSSPMVRFAGDAERAQSVYRGIDPLVAEDVADCIVWAATRPSHVNIDEIVVRPRDQATATLVNRRDSAKIDPAKS